jgi:1-aminocyclopropane-1-carboxylate deaminase
VALAIAAAGGARCDWRIEHQWHHGGYARVSHGLRQFLLEFESVQGIPLDPVYTGKLMYALYQLQARGDLDAVQPLLAIHTGGLQGRRGFPWLEEHTAIK